jgi:hypothetical protein
MVGSLRQRGWSRDMADLEKQNVFEKENRGYVRYYNQKLGAFYLDPSPFLAPKRNEIFVVKDCPVPPSEKLIEVVVRETAQIPELQSDKTVKITYVKYVSSWQEVDPNKIRRNKTLNKEEFLDFIAMPIQKKYVESDLNHGLGLYTLASPLMNDYQKGGINTTVLMNFYTEDIWGKFKRFTNVLPPEFRKTSSKNFYKNIDFLITNSEEVPDPVYSDEVSLAHYNNSAIPCEIPLPFNVEFNSLKSYTSNYKFEFSYARAYILDALLFQPEIPVENEPIVEEYVYELQNDFSVYGISKEITGALLVKLALSFARLNFEPEVNKENLEDAKLLWGDLKHKVIKTGLASRKFSSFYKLHADEKKVLSDLEDMQNTGIGLTIRNLKDYTTVNLVDLDDVLASLVKKQYIYFPNRNRIGFIKP